MSRQICILVLLIILFSCKKEEQISFQITDYKDQLTTESFLICSDTTFIWNYPSYTDQPIINKSCFSTITPNIMFDSIKNLLVDELKIKENCVCQVFDYKGEVKMIFIVFDESKPKLDTVIIFADIKAVDRLIQFLKPLTSPTNTNLQLNKVSQSGDVYIQEPYFKLVRRPISKD